jgi:S-adenosylmethionine synthetase
MNKDFLFSSESVTEGHPDKVADQISDAILDEIILCDKNGRVACETLVTTGMAMIAGEITTNCYVDIPKVAREVIKDIGYHNSDMGFDWRTCAVMTSIDKQSADIAQGVNGAGLFKEQGAGDQGTMFGYACIDTPVFMPMPIYLAHKLTQRLSHVRKSGKLPWLRPDGKSQVTVRYVDFKPVSVHSIVIAAQHSPDIDYNTLKEAIIEEIVKKVIPHELINGDTEFYINTTGRFVIGGPLGDCGMTGRKIIADTYGGFGYHGGGAFSGKDPSKVDRSASYMCRYIAKNIVAAGMAERCEIQVAYTIGKAEPLSLMVNTYDTGVVPSIDMTKMVIKEFDMRPAAIVEQLDLLRPIYKKTTNYGHFGRELDEFIWEKTDLVEKMKKAL